MIDSQKNHDIVQWNRSEIEGLRRDSDGIKMEYLFGPVLSRRLGLSMGVDLLPHKTCNMDCIYCELGRTACLAVSRGRFVPPADVLLEIESKKDAEFDHLTFAGSGEPTLSRDMGTIIKRAREIVDVPIAVITNSALLSSPGVRRELCEADVVLPSLDAATQKTFNAINRPAPALRIEEIIEGLKSFREEFRGEIWLEVMLVKGVNDHDSLQIAKAAEYINPDRVQLNTVVRPPAEPVLALSEREMREMLHVFQDAELIPDWDWRVPGKVKSELLALLRRRPCSLEEIGTLLDMEMIDAIKYLKIMEREGCVSRRLYRGRLYLWHQVNDRADGKEHS
jgi:wyosine [tRNA(Phe)-imidazoG37] synthetase (radical SAM superfamily)